MNREKCPSEHHCTFADTAAENAVKKTFAILGVDIDRPGDVEKFREDLRFGGRLRKFADKSAMAFWVAILGLVAAAIFLRIMGKAP